MRDRRIVLFLVAAVIIAGIAFFVHRRTAQTQAGAARDQHAAAGRPVPVVSGVVAKRDVPIYLDGLGSVAAFKTVTVRTQVDGRLDQVLFREGQHASIRGRSATSSTRQRARSPATRHSCRAPR